MLTLIVRKKVYLYESTIYRTLSQEGDNEGRSKASACGGNRFSKRYHRLLTTSRQYVEVIDCVPRERGGSPLAMTQTPRYYANQTGSPLWASLHKDIVDNSVG